MKKAVLDFMPDFDTLTPNPAKGENMEKMGKNAIRSARLKHKIVIEPLLPMAVLAGIVFSPDAEQAKRDEQYPFD